MGNHETKQSESTPSDENDQSDREVQNKVMEHNEITSDLLSDSNQIEESLLGIIQALQKLNYQVSRLPTSVAKIESTQFLFQLFQTLIRKSFLATLPFVPHNRTFPQNNPTRRQFCSWHNSHTHSMLKCRTFQNQVQTRPQ